MFELLFQLGLFWGSGCYYNGDQFEFGVISGIFIGDDLFVISLFVIYVNVVYMCGSFGIGFGELVVSGLLVFCLYSGWQDWSIVLSVEYKFLVDWFVNGQWLYSCFIGQVVCLLFIYSCDQFNFIFSFWYWF